jgi:hypothetical protein
MAPHARCLQNEACKSGARAHRSCAKIGGAKVLAHPKKPTFHSHHNIHHQQTEHTTVKRDFS